MQLSIELGWLIVTSPNLRKYSSTIELRKYRHEITKENPADRIGVAINNEENRTTLEPVALNELPEK